MLLPVYLQHSDQHQIQTSNAWCRAPQIGNLSLKTIPQSVLVFFRACYNLSLFLLSLPFSLSFSQVTGGSPHLFQFPNSLSWNKPHHHLIPSWWQLHRGIKMAYHVTRTPPQWPESLIFFSHPMQHNASLPCHFFFPNWDSVSQDFGISLSQNI